MQTVIGGGSSELQCCTLWAENAYYPWETVIELQYTALYEKRIVPEIEKKNFEHKFMLIFHFDMLGSRLKRAHTWERESVDKPIHLTCMDEHDIYVTLGIADSWVVRAVGFGHGGWRSSWPQMTKVWRGDLSVLGWV